MRCIFSHILSSMEKFESVWVSDGGHGELTGTLRFTNRFVQYFRGYFDNIKILSAHSFDLEVPLFRVHSWI